MYMCLCVCMFRYLQRPDEGFGSLQPPKLEFQVVVSHCVGTRNQLWFYSANALNHWAISSDPLKNLLLFLFFCICIDVPGACEGRKDVGSPGTGVR